VLVVGAVDVVLFAVALFAAVVGRLSELRVVGGAGDGLPLDRVTS
jgi:hypothetical protein